MTLFTDLNKWVKNVKEGCEMSSSFTYKSDMRTRIVSSLFISWLRSARPHCDNSRIEMASHSLQSKYALRRIPLHTVKDFERESKLHFALSQYCCSLSSL